MHIYNRAVGLSALRTTDAIIAGGQNVSENFVRRAGHSSTLGGKAYLMVTSAAELDARYEDSTPHMDLLTDLIPDIANDIRHYNPDSLDNDQTTVLTIDTIQKIQKQIATDVYENLPKSEKEEIILDQETEKQYVTDVNKIKNELLPTNRDGSVAAINTERKGLTRDSMRYLIDSDVTKTVKDVLVSIGSELNKTGNAPTKEQFNKALELISNNLKQYRGLSGEELESEYISIEKGITEPLNAILDPARIDARPRGEGSTLPTLAIKREISDVDKLSRVSEQVPLSIAEPYLDERSSKKDLETEEKIFAREFLRVGSR